MLKAISELVAKLPWSMLILFCLTLGLTSFFPIPQMWEKLQMFLQEPLSGQSIGLI